MGDIKNLGPLQLFPLLWAQYLKGFYRSGLSAASLLIWPQPPNNVCVSPVDHSLWLATYEIIKVLKLSSGLKWPLECKHSPCGWLSSWGGGDCSAAGSNWLAPPFFSHWKRVFFLEFWTAEMRVFIVAYPSLGVRGGKCGSTAFASPSESTTFTPHLLALATCG